MKILALCGSLRRASMNMAVLKVLEELKSADDEFIIADLRPIPIYDPDHEKEFPSAVEKLTQQIKAADALIIATPEYNYSVPGVLKNAIDWVSRHPSLAFAGKPTAILGASPGKIGTARAQYHLRQIGVFLDLRIMNKPEVMIGEALQKFDAHGKLIDHATREYLQKMFLSLKEFSKKN